jgi:hypothetical protein
MGLEPLHMEEDSDESEEEFDCNTCPKIRDIWTADF